MDAVADGTPVTITGGKLLVGGAEVAEGTLLDADAVEARMEAARDSIGNEPSGPTSPSTARCSWPSTGERTPCST